MQLTSRMHKRELIVSCSLKNCYKEILLNLLNESQRFRICIHRFSHFINVLLSLV